MKIDKILLDQISMLKKSCFFWCMMNASFIPFITWYVLLEKNKIHHKMQREKLYNLQRIIYILKARFVFKKKIVSWRSIFDASKILYDRIFVFRFLSPNMISETKIEYGERCSVKSSTICTGDKKIKRNFSFALSLSSVEI